MQLLIPHVGERVKSNKSSVLLNVISDAELLLYIYINHALCV